VSDQATHRSSSLIATNRELCIVVTVLVTLKDFNWW